MADYVPSASSIRGGREHRQGKTWLNTWAKVTQRTLWNEQSNKTSALPSPFAFFHRITAWFGLAGTFSGHLVQPPCHEQGHLQLHQVAQSPSNLALGISRDEALTTSPGNPHAEHGHPQFALCLYMPEERIASSYKSLYIASALGRSAPLDALVTQILLTQHGLYPSQCNQTSLATPPRCY